MDRGRLEARRVAGKRKDLLDFPSRQLAPCGRLELLQQGRDALGIEAPPRDRQHQRGQRVHRRGAVGRLHCQQVGQPGIYVCAPHSDDRGGLRVGEAEHTAAVGLAAAELVRVGEAVAVDIERIGARHVIKRQIARHGGEGQRPAGDALVQEQDFSLRL